MTIKISRISERPLIGGPGLSSSEYFLELPTLERLESAFRSTNGIGPTLYGWMDKERANFKVRESFTVLKETYYVASIKYDAGRLNESAVNLKDLPQTSFNAQGKLTPRGMRDLFRPLKEMVAVSANVHIADKSTDYSLVYSYSQNNGNPFFIFVGALDGKGHDYKKTLEIIAPDYSGLLITSSAEELKQKNLRLKEFLDDFITKLIPAIQSEFPRKVNIKSLLNSV